MEKFKKILQTRHEEAIKLKQEGYKLLGYFCSYCPEEIIYAAGLVPVRIFGTPTEYPKQTRHLQSYYCAHCHGCLEAGLNGDYDYLDGIVLPYACDHTRSAYESWRINKPMKYNKFIDMPSQVDSQLAKDFFVYELKRFAASLEEAFQVEITLEKMVQAISLCNENRALLRKLFQWKKTDSSPVSGIDTFYAILSSALVLKKKHSELLDGYLSRINGFRVDRSTGKRLMLLGTELHSDQIIAYLENNGAFVAADELCTGARYIWQDVDPGREPFEAVAERYLRGINCPIKRPGSLRLDFIKKMLDEYKIAGALMLHPKNCDPLSWDEPFIKRMLHDKGIPSFIIETETELTMPALAQNLHALLKP